VLMPGDVSQAHNGVLVLDALPECRRHGLEVWRQPLENEIVTIARTSGSMTYTCFVLRITHFVMFTPTPPMRLKQPAGQDQRKRSRWFLVTLSQNFKFWRMAQWEYEDRKGRKRRLREYVSRVELSVFCP
jgi:Magnesium chelatase, subunit ChlI